MGLVRAETAKASLLKYGKSLLPVLFQPSAEGGVSDELDGVCDCITEVRRTELGLTGSGFLLDSDGPLIDSC